ncbi:MAG: helix-turn-helix domain-containing protein [Alicyclobacillus sp.]|nr:helix-turn-helix domain-containing protein [Alicyclobacillus sp.]
MGTVGEKLRALRTERGWTLRELSERSGVSLSHLSAIENHTRPTPSLDSVRRIAKAFGVSLSVFDDEPRTPDSWLERARSLYEPETLAFLLREDARPYVDLAKSLAESSTDDPSAFLQRIAQFIQDRKAAYSGHSDEA